jgi:hypothetical protein
MNTEALGSVTKVLVDADTVVLKRDRSTTPANTRIKLFDFTSNLSRIQTMINLTLINV